MLSCITTKPLLIITQIELHTSFGKGTSSMYSCVIHNSYWPTIMTTLMQALIDILARTINEPSTYLSLPISEVETGLCKSFPHSSSYSFQFGEYKQNLISSYWIWPKSHSNVHNEIHTIQEEILVQLLVCKHSNHNLL